MAFGKRSVVSDNLNDFSLMIVGESGVGKTTVVSELCEKEFGPEGYLLLNTGDEDGVAAIDGVTYEDVQNYKKFIEICKDIMKNKKTEYPNLKVLVIDTLDQLLKITEAAAIENWNRENMGNPKFKPAKTLNSVEGGFGAGYDVVFNMIYDYVRALDKIGVKTYYICHSKTKDIIDPLTNASYTVLTSNMAQRYFNDFKTKVHVVGVACIDRTIEAEGTGRTNIINHKEITVNKVKEENRKIVFRDDNYSVDSKSRFSNIVNEIPLDSDELIKALKDAILKSKKTASVPKPTVTVKPPIVEEEDVPFDDSYVVEEEEEPEPVIEDIDIDDNTDTRTPEELIKEIRVKFKEASATIKGEVKKVINKYGKKLDDVTDIDDLHEILTILA